MALFDKIYKAKYSAKNYKKYCKDANSTFVYTSVYLSYNENEDYHTHKTENMTTNID